MDELKKNLINNPMRADYSKHDYATHEPIVNERPTCCHVCAYEYDARPLKVGDRVRCPEVTFIDDFTIHQSIGVIKRIDCEGMAIVHTNAGEDEEWDVDYLERE